MAKKSKKVTDGKKMILPGRHTPERKHHCPTHDLIMTPIKIFGKKAIQFQCKEGCQLSKEYAVLK
jgi:hypothetical protein